MMNRIKLALFATSLAGVIVMTALKWYGLT